MKQHEDYWVDESDVQYGNALILKTSWKDRFLEVIREHNIRVLRLNNRLGWSDVDISFILEIPDLEGIVIINEEVSDVSPVFRLKSLRVLSLTCNSSVAGDFTQLRKLERVFLTWRDVYESIFVLNILQRINIEGFPEKDLKRWKQNERLQELLLSSKKLESLEGIESFPNLRRLDLFKCPRFKSLNFIDRASHIQRLRFDRCGGVADLSPVANLAELKELEIEDCGNVSTVAPVSMCRNLERLQFAGNTTVVDGNLGSLRSLPKLRKVLLAVRKHYSHTGDDLVSR